LQVGFVTRVVFTSNSMCNLFFSRNRTSGVRAFSTFFAVSIGLRTAQAQRAKRFCAVVKGN
jgi:uroporphyrinogen-III synthase